MIQEAHTFKQSYNYVPQKDHPEHAHVPSANNSIMPILSWNPRGNFQNKPQAMEVDPPLHQSAPRFTQPPPPIVVQPQQQEVEQHQNNLTIKVEDNHNSHEQVHIVHLDDQAQLHVLQVKARPETSMTKTTEDSPRRINIKT
jgi:hypothetical protein